MFKPVQPYPGLNDYPFNYVQLNDPRPVLEPLDSEHH